MKRWLIKKWFSFGSFVELNKEVICLWLDNVFYKVKYDKGYKVIEYMNIFEVWDL